MTEQRLTPERRHQIEANDAGFETGAWRFPAACIGMANQRRELLAELRAVEAERDAAAKAVEALKVFMARCSCGYCQDTVAQLAEGRA